MLFQPKGTGDYNRGVAEPGLFLVVEARVNLARIGI